MPSTYKFPSGLNQWEPGDVLMRLDVNNDNQIINDAILHTPDAQEVGAVPNDATVNGMLVTSNPVLNFEDVNADQAAMVIRDTELMYNAWSQNVLYPEYEFMATIPTPGVTDDMVPEVYFAAEDAVTGEFAPIAITIMGGIRIFRKTEPEENTSMTIPLILLRQFQS
jgi:hypothetical protein